MKLVIVESPTKARTLSKFLGSEYTIKASMGHVMDLPKSVLGVDVENNFSPQYELVQKKESVVKELKSSAKSAESIILATDPDREGEAIASHVAQLITKDAKRISRNSQTNSRKFARIVFHEITKEAIEEALKNPRSIDKNLVEAQTARRVLDRLVGYKLSPLLWKKVRRGLSAGRVQSVAVRLIVEREREIEKFKKTAYWTIVAFLARGHTKGAGRLPHAVSDAQRATVENKALSSSSLSERRLPKVNQNSDAKSGSAFSSLTGGQSSIASDSSVEFELIEINSEKIEEKETLNLYDGEYTFTKTTIDKKEKADKILADLGNKNFQVSDVTQKEVTRLPYPPFTTSTLQQEASRRLGFTSKRTMILAQKLYEEGYITYHRTDSVVMAQQAVFAMRSYIEKEFGREYVNKFPRQYKTKQKLAQEAHEAIRPTFVGELQSQISNLKSQIGNDYAKLYELIWKRAVATQMADAVLESTTVYADTGDVILSKAKDLDSSPALGGTQNDKGGYRFKANGSVIMFDGFLKLYPQALSEQKLPVYSVGETLSAEKIDAIDHETTPPPRYNEASLIRTLEEKGIGRPSTYAPIISTIQDRQYVEREEGRFKPTSVGIAVNDFLVEYFSDIDDIPFTAEMEDDLDNIANGEKDWVPMIRNFYEPFEKKLEKVDEESKRVKIEVEKTDEKCEKCGSPLVIRTGRFGKFLSCSTFPVCDFTKSFSEETNLTCPKDGGKIVIKKTRRGRRFYGCSNYPNCNFAAWKLEDIKQNSNLKTQN